MNKLFLRVALLLAVPTLANAASQPLPLPERDAMPAVATPATAPAIPATRAALDPAQLQELRRRYAAWQALPEPERARIRDAAQRLSLIHI